MILILSALIAFAYFIRIGRLAIVWYKLQSPNLSFQGYAGISIVVPFRNEEKNLPSLLDTLRVQIAHEDNVELILVNDHSEDKSLSIAQAFCSQNAFAKLISLESSIGKKNALRLAIEKAIFQTIVTLDADISPERSWFEKLKGILCDNKTDLFILPVYVRENATFFGRMQCVEFMSILGVTATMASIGKPVLCNGAHLAFRKKMFEDSLKCRNDESISSGDDLFLLSYAKKNGRVRWVHLPELVVGVVSEKKWRSFFEQRIRWASKTGKISDRTLQLFAIQMWSTNAILMFTFFASIVYPHFWKFFLGGLFIKSFIDFFLVFQVSKWLCKKRLMIYFPLVSFFYPFYSTLVPLVGYFYRPTWKGRKTRLG